MSEATTTSLSRIGRLLGQRLRVSPADSIRHLFQRCSVSLWRGNAALWLRRFPTGLPSIDSIIINPRRACAARVTVLGSVCLLLSISLLGCLFVSQRIPPTERAMKVRKFERFSLKTLRCKVRALKSQYANTQRLTTA